jgi:hypothetical protein
LISGGKLIIGYVGEICTRLGAEIVGFYSRNMSSIPNLKRFPDIDI